MNDTRRQRTQRTPTAKAAASTVTDAERDAVHAAATAAPAGCRAQVAQIRGQIADLKRGRDGLAAVRANRTEVAQIIGDAVGAWHEHGTATLRAVLANTARLGHIDADAFRLPARGPADLGPLLCAMLGPQAVAAALLAHLDAAPDVPDAAGRAARLAEIDAELFRLECEEEALIEASEATDAEPIARRPDADPRAVIGLPVAADSGDGDDDDEDDDE